MRTQRRCAGAAVVSPLISTTSACALATPAATVPTPTSATSFTAMRALRIDVLQIVDQLRQIFDRIDIVMRRRRNQADSGNRMAQARDDFIDFVPGQLAAFAGFRALRHLDLQFVGVDQIVGGHAEACRRYLLDRAAPQIAIGIALEALFVFPALAGIGLAADAVHGDGQRLVRFFADRAERHGAGGEALHDLRRRLDFFERQRACATFLQLHQSAQRAELLLLLVDQIGVFLKVLKLSCRTACCSLLIVGGLSR